MLLRSVRNRLELAILPKYQDVHTFNKKTVWLRSRGLKSHPFPHHTHRGPKLISFSGKAIVLPLLSQSQVLPGRRGQSIMFPMVNPGDFKRELGGKYCYRHSIS